MCMCGGAASGAGGPAFLLHGGNMRKLRGKSVDFLGGKLMFNLNKAPFQKNKQVLTVAKTVLPHL